MQARCTTCALQGHKGAGGAELVAWLAEHRATPGAAMPALQKAQEIYGYLPIEVQRDRGR